MATENSQKMENFEKILDYIKLQSENECRDIAIKANRDSERILADYSKKEQDAYWSYVSNESKEIEKNVEKLSNYAVSEAEKMLHSLQQDMLDEVIALTAIKLAALPPVRYNELLDKLGLERGMRPEYLVEQYRDDLAPIVISALFD